MNGLQLELTKLIGSKELSLWCILESKEYNTWNTFLYETFDNKIVTLWHQFPTVETWEKWELEIIGTPATIIDLHRFILSVKDAGNATINNNKFHFQHSGFNIFIRECSEDRGFSVDYDSEKALLEQSEQTLKTLIKFIKSYT